MWAGTRFISSVGEVEANVMYLLDASLVLGDC